MSAKAEEGADDGQGYESLKDIGQGTLVWSQRAKTDRGADRREQGQAASGGGGKRA